MATLTEEQIKELSGDLTNLSSGLESFSSSLGEQSVISTDTMAGKVDKATTTKDQLSGPTQVTSAKQFKSLTGREPELDEKSQIEAGVLSYDPSTGKTFSTPKTFSADTRTEEQIRLDQIISLGGVPEEGGTIRKDLTSEEELSVGLRRQKIELEEAKSKLRYFDNMMANDPQLKSIQNAVASMWDTRVKEMQDINRRTEQNLKTLGFRLGAQQTSGAMFATVVSAQERDSMAKISDLEAKKQTALLEAASAYRSDKWDQYVAFVDEAETEYNNQIKAIKEFNKVVKEQQEKALAKARNDAALSMLQGGVTDPLAIAQAIGLELKDVSDMIEDLDFKTRIDSVVDGIELVFSSLTGDEATEFLKKQAKEFGIPPKQLFNAVTKKALERQAKEKAQSIQERAQATRERAQALAEAKEAARLREKGSEGKYFDKETGKEMTPFDAARAIVKANPNATEDEVVNAIRENILDVKGSPILSVGDAQRIAREGGAPAKRFKFTESQLKDIAIEIRKSAAEFFTGAEDEMEAAKQAIQRGELDVNGKTVQLTQAQINRLLEIIEEEFPGGERSILQRVLPGGK